MTWGPGLLDEANLAKQQQELAATQNTWGPGLDIPASAPEAVATVPAAPSEPALPPEQGLSVARVEQRLAEDPKWWEAALVLEMQRQSPRKSALRAIVRTMEAEGVAADTIEAARAVLAATGAVASAETDDTTDAE